MPVIPMSRLPMANQGAPHYGRAQAPGASYYRNAAPGAQLAASLAGVAEKAAGLWLQANQKAKEAKAAMDLDEIRVKAEAAYRDNFTALSQDPDGYETFGDRSQKNFLTLRQDCRELLDGLPAEHRRKAELYLVGQASRWGNDTEKLQYQARVTALSGQAALSVQSQVAANDWDGAQETVRVAVEQGVYTTEKGEAMLADIRHREAFAAALDDVKANPARAAEYLEKNEDGTWTKDVSGLTAEDREKLARHGEALVLKTAKELADEFTTVSASGESFDLNQFDYALHDGRITQKEYDGLVAMERAWRAKKDNEAFDASIVLRPFQNEDEVAAAIRQTQEDSRLDDKEKVRRIRILESQELQLKQERHGRDVEVARRQQNLATSVRYFYEMRLGDDEYLEWLKGNIRDRYSARWVKDDQHLPDSTFRILQDIVETEGRLNQLPQGSRQRQELERELRDLNAELRVGPTAADVRKWVDAGWMSKEDALRLVADADARWDRYQTETRKSDLEKAVVNLRFTINSMDLPNDPQRRSVLYNNLCLEIAQGIYPYSPKEAEALRKSLDARFGEVAGTWREDKQLVDAYDAYMNEQKDKYFHGADEDGRRAADTRKFWCATVVEWLERHPKATEEEMRAYGEQLKRAINTLSVGEELDAWMGLTTANLHRYDLNIPQVKGGQGRR